MFKKDKYKLITNACLKVDLERTKDLTKYYDFDKKLDLKIDELDSSSECMVALFEIFNFRNKLVDGYVAGFHLIYESYRDLTLLDNVDFYTALGNLEINRDAGMTLYSNVMKYLFICAMLEKNGLYNKWTKANLYSLMAYGSLSKYKNHYLEFPEQDSFEDRKIVESIFDGDFDVFDLDSEYFDLLNEFHDRYMNENTDFRTKEIDKKNLIKFIKHNVKAFELTKNLEEKIRMRKR